MKIFEHPNLSGDWKCPVCGRNEDLPVALIPIGEVGHGDREVNLRARQYHLECISLVDFNSRDLRMDGNKRVMLMMYSDQAEDLNEIKEEIPEVSGS